MAYANEIEYSSQAELDAARENTRNKWRSLYSDVIEEGRRHGRSELESMDRGVSFSKVMTPEENREYRWAFEPLGTKAWPWRKWGGGNKMGSGGAKVVAARKARAEARRSAPDANKNPYTNPSYDDGFGFKANQFFAGINAKFNDTQGKNLPSNPSWGFSQQTLNAADARGADPSFAGEAGRNVYGGDMRSSYGNDSSSSFGSNFLSSYLNSPNLFRENPVEIASHDKPFSRYPAAGGPDKWPGMPSDAIKRYVHPSTNPITFFVNPYRV